MNKKIKTLLALSLAVTTIFSACGTENSTATNTSDSSNKDTSNEAEDDSILTETGTYPVVKEGEELTISIFAPLANGISSYEAEDNELTKWLCEKTGINIEWMVATSADAVAKLNTMMTSGTYTDVILNSFWTQSEQRLYAEQGIIIPLTDLIKEHGPNIQKALDENPAVISNMTLEDGEMYSLANIGAATHMVASNKIWLNEKWIDNLGLNIPTTTDELEDVLIAFRDKDANGNGDTTDEIPLSGSLYGWNTDIFKALMNSFTYYDGTNMYVDDGTVVYTKTTDEWKEGLKWFKGLVDQGLVDPLLFTQNKDEFKSLCDNANGTVVGLGAGGNISSMVTLGDSDRWREYTAIAPLKGPEGVQNAIYNPSYGTARLNITETCECPEAVIRLFDIMYTEEGYTFNSAGIHGIDYVDAEEGAVNFIGEPAKYTEVTSSGERDGRCWSGVGPWYKFPGEELLYSSEPGDIETILYNATNENYIPYLPSLDSIVPISLGFSTDESRAIVDIVTPLTTTVDEYTAKFAMGLIDIDAEWDNYVAVLDSLGLQEYIAIYQEAITKELAK